MEVNKQITKRVFVQYLMKRLKIEPSKLFTLSIDKNFVVEIGGYYFLNKDYYISEA